MLNNYTKDDINKWLFTDEKFFDLDGIYSVQNDRIWVVSKEEADTKGAVHEKTKFLVKIMIRVAKSPDLTRRLLVFNPFPTSILEIFNE